MPKVKEPSLYDQIKLGLIVVNNGSPIAHRFWNRVDKNGPIHPIHGQCWNWWGARNGGKYGHIRNRIKMTLAHRMSWELHYGPIPDELLVLHKCDNPPCTNPHHLFLGTYSDNTQDCLAKGRHVVVLGRRDYGDDHFARRHPELVLRGDRHGMSELTNEEVLEIARTYRKGVRGFGVQCLAKKFGVANTTIFNIITGFRWGHITGIKYTRGVNAKAAS